MKILDGDFIMSLGTGPLVGEDQPGESTSDSQLESRTIRHKFTELVTGEPYRGEVVRP